MNAVLRVAQSSVDINVTDVPPLVRSDSSELSTTLDSRSLTVLPLPTRNFLQLLTLAPGVTATIQVPVTVALPVLAQVSPNSGPQAAQNLFVTLTGQNTNWSQGTTTANFELGMKRATAVRDLLVQAGLESAAIAITSHGEGELLIPTADDVPEPRNRRVEISVR